MLKSILYTKVGVIILLFLNVFLIQGCNNYKNIAYFTDLQDTVFATRIVEGNYSQPVIQPDDILSITVHTIDPQSSASINQSMTLPTIGASSATPIGNQLTSGFLVDQNGEVQLSMIGKVKLAGLSTHEARDLLTSRAARYYKDPSVQVRFANFKITLIGEVARPATYTVPNEKISLLDALGLAGDLTIFGRRENVLLVRENNGTKEFVRFNLNSSNLFKSPYFYLKQNDVIYVEPTKGKAASTDAARTRTITLVASFISVLIVAFSRLL